MDETQTKAASTNGVTPAAPATTAPKALPKEPERVFRTYASDLAALGKLPATPAPAPKPAAPMPQPQAVIKEEPIIVEPEPAPLPPPPPPKPIPPPQPAPKAPEPTDEERAAILARLKARVEEARKQASWQRAPAPVPTPVPVAPPPLPKAEELSRIHTYKSDFADNIHTKSASAASVLAAQADAPRKATPAAPVRKSSIAYALGSILILIVAGAGVYLAYGYATSNQIIVTAPTAPSLIFVDDRKEISGTPGRDLLSSLASAASTPLAAQAVRQLYITRTSTSTLGTTGTPATGGELVSALQLPAPDILLRSIQPATTVGVVNAGSEQRAFFILKVDSFERSFAGMLAWEPTIAEDLAPLYPSYPTVAAPVAAPVSVATSTLKTKTVAAPSAPAPVVVRTPVFNDEVLASHDVRVLRDASGKSVIIYGYWDQTTLIIARDEAAFTELVNRLATTRQQ